MATPKPAAAQVKPVVVAKPTSKMVAPAKSAVKNATAVAPKVVAQTASKKMVAPKPVAAAAKPIV